MINKKIENPVFFLSFGLPVFLLPFCAYLFRDDGVTLLLVVASVLHIAGGVGVTAAGNIPLNNELAKVDVNKISDSEAKKIRAKFQKPFSSWMKFHFIRTIASIGAALLSIIALQQIN